MFKIRDWLYVGGVAEASNKDIVEQNGINAMLQLFEEIKLSKVNSHFIPVRDGIVIPQDKLKEGIDFGIQQHEKNKTLLVTCGMGISRSVTFATGILKEVEGLTLKEAYLEIRRHHPDALPDHIHWDSLREYFDEGPEFWEVWQSIVLDDDDEV